MGRIGMCLGVRNRRDTRCREAAACGHAQDLLRGRGFGGRRCELLHWRRGALGPLLRPLAGALAALDRRAGPDAAAAGARPTGSGVRPGLLLAAGGHRLAGRPAGLDGHDRGAAVGGARARGRGRGTGSGRRVDCTRLLSMDCRLWPPERGDPHAGIAEPHALGVHAPAAHRGGDCTELWRLAARVWCTAATCLRLTRSQRCSLPH
mmetsp:Transcript_103494/g.288163  ORF Transcript_103494/g.288163 Transcript_103494/m.288163 type:complete len:206 (+) Transcript_103494:1207-1824(+)